VGTYLQNLLKRLILEQLGSEFVIYVQKPEDIAWVHRYQPGATIKVNPISTGDIREQFFWKQNLDGKGAFWSPTFHIPWWGYKKLVVTLHDIFPLTPYAPLPLRATAPFIFWQIRQRADAVLTVSDFTRHELIERAGIPDEKIDVIPNGVDPSWFLSELPPRPYPFNYLVCVADFRSYKNLPALLKAFAQSHISQRLVLVGRSATSEYSPSRISGLVRGLKTRVLIEQDVSNDRLRALVKHADGLVLVSLYEGFGMPPLEAMASRTPVLVSNTSALPEICADHALYCDPYRIGDIADGLARLGRLSERSRDQRVAKASNHRGLDQLGPRHRRHAEGPKGLDTLAPGPTKPRALLR
jgi:glycosyltransferase involved in cell wall biosynthesis